MNHAIKKFKLKSGKDANEMLLRKLAYNFLSIGYMVTTDKKAKALKTFMEKIVSKSKENNEANKNNLLKYFPHKKVINVLFNQVGPVLKDKVGGYTKIMKLAARDSDGALMVKIQWAHPVVINWENKPEVKEEKVEKVPAKAKKTEKK